MSNPRRRPAPRLLNSLRARLLVLFGVLAVGPLVIVGVIDYVRSRRAVESLITTQTDTLARRAAANVSDRYGVIASDIRLLTENADVQNYLHVRAAADSAQIRAARDVAAAFLATAWKTDSASYHEIQLRDTTGAVIFRFGESSEQGFRDHGPTLTSPWRDVAFGRMAGTLVLEPRMATLFPADALGLPFGRTGRTVVIDRANDRIIHSGRGSLGTQTAHLLLGAAWPRVANIASVSGQIAFDDAGSRRVGTFVNLTEPEWTIVSSTRLSEFADTFARTRTLDFFFLLTLGGLAAIAFIILVSRATRSLEELTRAAAQVGEGELSPALPAPTPDEVGTLTRAFGHMTERIRAMLREIEVSRQLAVLGEFAAQLSHEVRNPLTSLKLDLQGMQRQVRSGAISPDAAPAIESALREINRLDTVVRGVLELGRQSPPVRQSCSVHDALDAALRSVGAQLAQRGIEIERCLDAAHTNLQGDANLLTGMFMNLLLNASDAQPEGGAIGVHSANRETEAHWIDVTIADNGAGIPAERRDDIFRPFVTSRHDGTGLGLSLALRTAREHGGHIEMRDPPAGYRGAAFTVSLPLTTA